MKVKRYRSKQEVYAVECTTVTAMKKFLKALSKEKGAQGFKGIEVTMEGNLMRLAKGMGWCIEVAKGDYILCSATCLRWGSSDGLNFDEEWEEMK